MAQPSKKRNRRTSDTRKQNIHVGRDVGGGVAVAGADFVGGDKYIIGPNIDLVKAQAEEIGQLQEKLRNERQDRRTAEKKQDKYVSRQDHAISVSRIADLERRIELLESPEARTQIKQSQHLDDPYWAVLIDGATEMLRFFPRSGSLYHFRGFVHSNAGDQEKAIADYSEAIRLKRKDAKAYHNRGIAYHRDGNHEKAIADYSDAIRLNPKLAVAFYCRGIAYGEQGEGLKAIADYNEAIRLNRKFAAAYNNRGVLYNKQGERDKAIKDYTEAIRLKRRDPKAYNNRGNLYIAQGKYDKAITDYNEAILLDRKETKAYLSRGNMYLMQRQYENAIADYSEVIRLEPKLTIGYLYRGYMRFNLGQITEALDDFVALCELEPNSSIYQNNRAYLALRLGRINEAKTAWQAATRVPDAPHYAFAGYGIVLWMKEKRKEAISAFETAVTMDSRWGSDIGTVAQELQWTEEMITAAREVVAAMG